MPPPRPQAVADLGQQARPVRARADRLAESREGEAAKLALDGAPPLRAAKPVRRLALNLDQAAGLRAMPRLRPKSRQGGRPRCSS
jgi:hypothetical protein